MSPNPQPLAERAPAEHLLRGRLVGSYEAGSPMNLLTAVEQHFRRRCSGLLVGCSRRLPPGRPPELLLRLHPLDLGLTVVAEDEQTLRILGEPSRVGPGFGDFLTRELLDLAARIGLSFDEPLRIDPLGASERAKEVLQREARAALDELTQTGQPGQVLLPDHVRFLHEGVVATPFGPRAMPWLAAAALGAVRAAEVFPWPDTGLSARYHLGRALSLMWTEVRWRAPQAREEAATLVEVHALLSRAVELEPNLELPWAEWAELLGWIQAEGALADEVRHRAQIEPRQPRVGYRRRPIHHRLPGGWWITIPGNMHEGWEGAAIFYAQEGSRSLWVSVLNGREAAAPVALRRSGHALTHEGDGISGIAQVGRDDDDPTLQIFSGQMFSTQLATGAVITNTFVDPADAAWADAVWRSLRLDEPIRL